MPPTIVSTIKEVSVNVILGKMYYCWNVAPRIKAARKKYSYDWKGKKACLILSYDLDETTDIKALPKLLNELKKYRLKANFAVIGLLAEKSPSIFRKIIAEGHELINHTQTHPDCPEFNPRHFHEISREERAEEIVQCHETVKRLFNYEMKGFRVPHFGHQYQEDIYPVLKNLKYLYSSSTVGVKTKSEGFPFRYKNSGIWELPMVCCQRHPYCIFDTSHAFRSRLARHSASEYLKSFGELLDFGIENSMFINIYQDPQDLDKFDIGKMLKLISGRRESLWMPTYTELVKELNRQKL